LAQRELFNLGDIKMKRSEILKAFKLWENSELRTLRFGQWFLNNYFPDVIAPVIFHDTNPRTALNRIVNDKRFCNEEEKNQ
jgi:hypothetical protein